MIKFVAKETGITDRLNAMRKRANAMQGFLNRNVFRMYQNFQRERWMTENRSEGVAWERLNPSYAARKRRQFADYPGKGTKMLVATGTLLESVIGPGKGFRKIVSPKRLYIFTVLDYSRYVNDVRPFTGFSDRSMNKVLKSVKRFISRGIDRVPREVR